MAAALWRVVLDPQEAPVEQEVRDFHVGTAAEWQQPGGRVCEWSLSAAFLDSWVGAGRGAFLK